LAKMRIVRFGAFALAAALSVPLVMAAPAEAAATTTLYVNNGTGGSPAPKCSDAGTGTASQPYCSISAAVAVAQSGQTVLVSGGNYNEQVNVTRSGSPGEPITIKADDSENDLGEPMVGNTFATDNKDMTHAFVLQGVHDVVISGFIVDSEDANIVVDGSSNITLAQNNMMGTSLATYGVEVLNASQDTSIIQNEFSQGGSSDIEISDSTGTSVSTNLLPVNGDYTGVSATDAPGTGIVSNTVVTTCGLGIDLEGSSTGSTIENNIVTTTDPSNTPVVKCAAGSTDEDLTVSTGSAAGTRVAYNLLDPASTGPAYSWAGDTYSTVAAFATASGQGSHDIVAPAGVEADDFELLKNSPAIDSADAKAPGELPDDIRGQVRSRDRNVAATGTGVGYYDRGAWEYTNFGSGYTAVTPTRVLDTRSKIGVRTTVPVAAGATVVLPLAGTNGLPSNLRDIQAVALNVTVTQPTAAGYLTVGPHIAGGYKASNSDLNWKAGETIPNMVVVPIFYDGSAQFTNHSSGSVHIVVDLEGYYAYTGASGYQAMTPTRILDTRSKIGVSSTTPVSANGSVTLQITGQKGVPSTGVTAVAMNVTVTQPTRSGSLTVYPHGQTKPTASNLNWTPGETIPNLVIVPVVDGKVTFANNSGGTVHLLADLAGFYSADAAPSSITNGGADRLLDTRSKIGVSTTTPVGPNKSVTFSVTGQQGEPASGITAVVLNITAVSPTASGYLTAYPHGQAQPTASDLNWTPGETIPNLVTIPVVDGKVTLTNHSNGTVHLVADLESYFSYYAN